MDNNNVIQPLQPAQPIVSQPTGAMQPTEAAQPTGVAQPTETNGAAGDGAKKKKILIIGCSAGAAIIILIVALLIVLLSKGGVKTVVCNAEQSVFGISVKNELRITAGNGEISSASSVVDVDLTTLGDTYKAYESQIVDSLSESFEEQKENGCEVEQSYTKGESMKITLRAKKGTGCLTSANVDTENKSAQEIADEVQDLLESSISGTCKQE